MKNNFESDQAEICINCERSTAILNSDACLCEIKGVVKAGGSCKKFKLDLLKIDPSPIILIGKEFIEK